MLKLLSINNIYISTGVFVLSVFMMLFFTSCKGDDIVTVPVPVVQRNLVIVSDNDQGSYLMVKVLGKVRSSFPDVQVTYFQSKQYDIYEGAFLLNTAFQTFPAGTVFAGIVEPGAGGKRLVFEASSRRVFAPDNTLATWILNNNSGAACYYVENSKVLGGAKAEDLSFEDFYADALCSLLAGTPTAEFGSGCSAPLTFPVQQPSSNGNTIKGQILFTDNFGNCISNIPESMVAAIPLGTSLALTADTVKVTIKKGITYSSVQTGDNVCFVNGSKLLELSVNMGSFSEKYNLKAGAQITLTK